MIVRKSRLEADQDDLQVDKFQNWTIWNLGKIVERKEIGIPLQNGCREKLN